MTKTRDRLLAEALVAFAGGGYGATSLDDVAAASGVRKQTILYYFPSKEILLHAVIDYSAAQLTEAFERALSRSGGGWQRVEAVVNAVFRLAVRRPEVVAIVREVSRLGPPATTRFTGAIEPLVTRATGFLAEEMAAGRLRTHDPRLVLLLAYSAIVAVTTELDALRAVHVEPSPRALVRWRRDLLGFFRAALLPPPGDDGSDRS